MEDLHGKITDLENQIFELQQENHLLVTKRIELKNEKDLQIATLQDQLEFASEQADTFAKSLKVVYDQLDSINDKCIDVEMKLKDAVILGDAKDFIFAVLEKATKNIRQLKNSIPENALKRAE